MASYNLTTIRPKGFLHSSAFAEVKDSLAWALSALSHEARLTENAFSQGASTNILFGTELLSPTSVIPPGSILYNLEQPSHPNIRNVAHLARTNKCTLWEYSRQSVAMWAKEGITAVYVPIGYTPNLTRVPRAPIQDIDVCFLGWMTPRRVKLLAQLRAAGLTVYSSDSCYGGARDEVLSRTKVALNIHHDGRDRFEVVRVSYLMANGIAVVTEPSSDDGEYEDVLPALRVAPYDSLVDECVRLVKSGDYSSVGRLALDAIESRDYVATVEATIEPIASYSPQPTSTTYLNITATAPSSLSRTASEVASYPAISARYTRALTEGDQVAFAAKIRELAHGQCLEIGTRDGGSTSAILLGLDDKGGDGHLTSIDIADCSALWTHPRWTFHRTNSLLARFPDASFDFILIDGAHDEPTFIGDLHNAYAWARPGALILSHDIRPERGHEFYAVQLRERWEWFAKLKGMEHYELDGQYGMGVMVR